MALKLNHIGLVVESIPESVEIFRTLELGEATHPEPDPIQKVSASFMKMDNERCASIELLEPTDDRLSISNFLKQRGGELHHLCFEVDDIEGMTRALKRRGLELVCSPIKCTGYDRSFKLGGVRPTKIAFFLLANKILIELLEKGA